jgi:hypothetical protein
MPLAPAAIVRPILADLPPPPSDDEAPFDGPEDGFGLEWTGEEEGDDGPRAPAVQATPAPAYHPATKWHRWFFLGDGPEEFEGEFAERPSPGDWRDRFGYRHHDDELGEVRIRVSRPDDDGPYSFADDLDDAEAA